jgi:hypothetical protein
MHECHAVARRADIANSVQHRRKNAQCRAVRGKCPYIQCYFRTHALRHEQKAADGGLVGLLVSHLVAIVCHSQIAIHIRQHGQ